jgi:hypothetical protein
MRLVEFYLPLKIQSIGSDRGRCRERERKTIGEKGARKYALLPCEFLHHNLPVNSLIVFINLNGGDF